MLGKKALAWRSSSILNRAGRSMMSLSVRASSFLRMSRFQSRQRWERGKEGVHTCHSACIPERLLLSWCPCYLSRVSPSE